MARIMANMDSVLMEKPKTWNAAKVPTSDTGMASIGTMVARKLPRKMYTTINTRIRASTKVWATFVRDSRTNWVLSLAMTSFMSGGKRVSASASTLRISETVSRALASVVSETG